MEENSCKNCKYFHTHEEYWHDHYLIPAYHFCAYNIGYNEREVEPDGCCENYQNVNEAKRKER